MNEPRLTTSSRLLVLGIFVSMVGVFIGLAGLMAGYEFAKPILIASAVGMIAVLWLSDVFGPFDRFSSRKRKQD
ncbi:UNVERIFIED_ORG: hypothetical protein J2W66_002409 [Agrobacterium larrymoorei]|jgi:hypothetical protein|uniref:hypothetical protein n=1 Tax=Agrobacterium TaxID=357 RepID=UPI000DDD3D9D|nr:hypothetical protein [Agrobacterium cavarae]MDP9571924.1 hypothetical protein [Agrobacterium larrymoorei]